MDKPERTRAHKRTSYRGEVWLVALLMLLLLTIPSLANAYGIYENKQRAAVLEARSHQLNEQTTVWNRLDRAQSLFKEGNYPECAHMLSNMSADSALVEQRIQQLFEQCYGPWASGILDQAKAKAIAGEFGNAIALAAEIEKGVWQQEADRWINKWSKRILELAIKEYRTLEEGALDKATDMLAAIPSRSRLSNTAQSKAEDWNQEWISNISSQRTALSALTYNDTRRAKIAALDITEHVFWVPRKEHLLTEIKQREQALIQRVENAKRMLASGSLQSAYQEAKALPDTEPWRQSKLEILERISISDSQPAQRDWNTNIVFLGSAAFLLVCCSIRLLGG
ncbi:hypothetical protein [cf. Phormidesmis sp. LEGE 11477]|uniref:hypothetical protein n=1 Tax=cf. Phormidesmis sp. LEGE 11477 TaxID=1828680 RepID=UPI00187F15A6|nr:hypothetical protein [cf. Phormidesmis sp. LEGE 11477]MBE9062835.1 hypothetical protein [cf. Phormidesmis sp. LEGE 11477]